MTPSPHIYYLVFRRCSMSYTLLSNRIHSVAGALMAFADLSDSDVLRYGQASRAIIQGFSYGAAVAGVCQALEAVPAQ